MRTIQKLDMVAKDGERPHAFRLPRPVPAQALLQIASRFENRIPLAPNEPLHIVAVATGGDQIASAVLTHFAVRHPNTAAWLSTVNIAKPINIISPLLTASSRRPRTVVVDNSINTGHTMHQVLKLLESKLVPFDLVVKLIDHDDEYETGAVEFIRLEHHVQVLSLFSIDEINPVRDPD